MQIQVENKCHLLGFILREFYLWFVYHTELTNIDRSRCTLVLTEGFLEGAGNMNIFQVETANPREKSSPKKGSELGPPTLLRKEIKGWRGEEPLSIELIETWILLVNRRLIFTLTLLKRKLLCTHLLNND